MKFGVFAGVVGLMGGWFDELEETYKAVLALGAAAMFGASVMLGAMSYINLPEQQAANRTSIDSLASTIDSLEEVVEVNQRRDQNFRQNISRRIELMCREILEDPSECELRFEPQYPSLQGTNVIQNLVTDETQQEMQQSGVWEFRPEGSQVLRRLPSGFRQDGTTRAGRRTPRRGSGTGA